MEFSILHDLSFKDQILSEYSSLQCERLRYVFSQTTKLDLIILSLIKFDSISKSFPIRIRSIWLNVFLPTTNRTKFIKWQSFCLILLTIFLWMRIHSRVKFSRIFLSNWELRVKIIVGQLQCESIQNLSRNSSIEKYPQEFYSQMNSCPSNEVTDSIDR